MKSKFSYKDNWVTITMNNQNDTSKYTRFVGALDDNQTSFSGTVVDESGNESSFTAIKKSDKKKVSKNER